ncbi:MAG: serine/threonine protein kinase [Pirellulales bacterium]
MLHRFTRWFRSPANADGRQAHMTFAHTSIGRSISRAGVFFKKQLWIWPIIAVVLLAVIGWTVSGAIERTIKDNLRSELTTLLGVERSMLETWLNVQEANAESLANDQQIRAVALEILDAVNPVPEDDCASRRNASSDAHRDAVAERAVGARAAPGMTSHQFASFFIADKRQRILASNNPELLGQTVPRYEAFLTRALDGHTTACAPFPSVVQMKDEFGRTKTDVPTMFVCAPIRDANFQVVAVLALRIRPEKEFTRILQLGRLGKTGETYAFDKAGMLVSNSRFDEDMILLGLLPDVEDSQSILKISLRDPGGNMRKGFRPTVRRAELPFTKPVAAALNKESGVDVEGFPDYKGVPSVGAWEWLPKYEMGLITEIDYDEAFRPLTILRWAFYIMYGLLTLGAVAIFVFTLIVARLNRAARLAAVEAKQLGQYRLEQRIGSGAMGIVYKGHHAMLRRPTAIKMLNLENVNDASIERFEREVQITCNLNHPNTIAIYDYGRTPEGVFYYAMEFLDGIDLQSLVEKYGPQSPGRVIQILQQICGSLYEAHSQGMVHRDIKPANVMLNRRGGEPDVVKVLDFGLVKALDDGKQAGRTGGLAGTPLYMSPEAIQSPDSVDPRSDLYAVGAVGYFLLTGQPVFHAQSLVELCRLHVVGVPETPSQRVGRAINPELESALLACLEKNRAKRPQTVRDLAHLLERAIDAERWTIDDAEHWWGRHERGQAIPSDAGTFAAPPSAAAPTAGPATGTHTGGKTEAPPPPPPNADTASRFDRTIDQG